MLSKSEDSTTAYGDLVTCVCSCAEYRRSLAELRNRPMKRVHRNRFLRPGHAWTWIAILVEIAILSEMAILVEMGMMAMYGHAWPEMAIHGHAWPYMAMLGHGHVYGHA